MLPAFAAMLLCAGPAPAAEIQIGGTGGALATMRLLGDAYVKAHPADTITVLPSLGSGGGIKAVLSGAIQIAVISRPLKDTEAKSGAVAVEYGRTPFVFATAAANKTTGLAMKELVDIYSGRTERWPDGTRIRLILRPVGDSDSDAIKAMSPAMRDALSEAEKRKGMAFAVTDQDAAESLEKISGALGPLTLAQILSERRALKALRLDDAEPTTEATASGRYPHYKTLLLVVSPKSPDSVKQFIAFVRSAPGRQILLRNGHWVK